MFKRFKTHSTCVPYVQLSHISITITVCVHVVPIFLYSKLLEGNNWVSQKVPN